VAEKLPTFSYDFGTGNVIEVPNVVKTIRLEDGTVGHIDSDGVKTLVSSGWLAFSTTGPVDWE
jgi:hypothetical protein